VVPSSTLLRCLFRRELFLDLVEQCPVIAVELDEFIVAEKQVGIIVVGENVSTPSIQHRELEERGKVFSFVFQKQVTGRLMEQAIVAIGLPKALVKVPIFRALPDAPFGNPEQSFLLTREHGCNPVGDVKDTVRLMRIEYPLLRTIGNFVRLHSLEAGEPRITLFSRIKTQVTSIAEMANLSNYISRLRQRPVIANG